jgi:hypothetical protein
MLKATANLEYLGSSSTVAGTPSRRVEAARYILVSVSLLACCLRSVSGHHYSQPLILVTNTLSQFSLSILITVFYFHVLCLSHWVPTLSPCPLSPGGQVEII